MIELTDDCLVFTFPEVHPEARLEISFQRTLRIPDDGRDYPLPPGLGRFPVRHVDDFLDRLPEQWRQHGGVMLPMFQSEAMWMSFQTGWDYARLVHYPLAIQVAAGKVNAVTGDPWSENLCRNPQDYMVAPDQPWLDGYNVSNGIIRQFVAMPLGDGYSAEEQLTEKAEHGGLQIAVRPMRRSVFERGFPKRTFEDSLHDPCEERSVGFGMALGPGGRMRQAIYKDYYDLTDWETEHSSRCFVHVANSLVWRSITGSDPPTTPFTAAEYTSHGLPWFEYYSDTKALPGSHVLHQLLSIVSLGKAKGTNPLPENKSVEPTKVVTLRAGLRPGQVREGRF